MGFDLGQLRIPEDAFALSGASKHQTATEHHHESPVNDSADSLGTTSNRKKSSKKELRGVAGTS